MYLNAFNYFRAIAILFIVAGHTMWLSGWDFGDFTARLVLDLVSGGTTLFVFISGFLYHHIFHGRRGYRAFITTKLKNVLLPYLLLSTPVVAYYVFWRHTGPMAEHFFLPEGGVWGGYLRPFLLYLWTGRTFDPYWYIPFVMLLFVAAPLFDRYIALGARARLALLAPLLLLALLLHRPPENLDVVQSLLYFVPVYLAGILASLHREALHRHLGGGRCYLLLAAVVGLAWLQAAHFDALGNFHKAPWPFTVPDLMLVQKLLLCLFLMVWLERFEGRHWRVMNLLASASFAIYFIHPFLLAFALPLVRVVRSGSVPLDWLAATVVAVAGSYAVAWGVRRLLPGGRSRHLIGW